MDHNALKEQLERIIEAIPTGVLIVAERGTILFANSAVEWFFGTSRSDIVGRRYDDPIFIVRTPEGVPLAEEGRPVNMVLRTKQPVRGVEYAIKRVDGRESVVLVNANPLFDESGEIQAVVVSYSDITDRKYAEEKLQLSEAMYRSLIEQTPAITYIAALDEKSTTLYISPQVETILGYAREKYRSDPDIWRKNLHPEDRDRVMREVARVHQDLQPFVAEYRMIAEDGDTVWFCDEAAVVMDRDGKPLVLQGVMLDITERKRTEEALIASEANYRTIFDSVNDAIFIHNIETGEIFDVNRAMREMFGLEPYEEHPLTVDSLSAGPPFTQDEAFRLVKKAAEEGPQVFEWRAKDKRGRLIWVEVNLKRIVLGGQDRILAVVRDISERKKSEAALREAYNALEQRVAERTSELSVANKRLKHEMAERVRLSDMIRLLLQSTDQGIYGFDMKQRCVFINSAALKITGYAMEEVLGKSTHELFHHSREDGSPYPLNACPVFRAALTGRGVRIDTEVFWRKDGTPVPVEYSANPIMEGGAIIGAVVAFSDISERRRGRELGDALNEINAAVSSTFDFDEIMGTVVDRAAKALRAQSAAICLREGAFWVTRYLYGLPATLLGTRFTDEQIPAELLARKVGKPVVVTDALSDDQANKRMIEEFGALSYVAVPLSLRKNMIGILVFMHRSRKVSFSDAELDFAGKISASVSLALENARLYAVERSIADVLQEALVSTPTRIPGAEYGFLYRSATEAARVGGDFYDLFEIEHEKIGIIIGDVSGKGIEAAALTSIVKNSIKAYAYTEETPSSIMAMTNDMVRKETGEGVFISTFFGILDKETGRLEYCSAGHPPGIIRRSDSTVELLDTNSPVIGTFAGIDYRDDTARLGRGDVLLLYTDGVTEARCNGGFFGEERLAHIMQELRLPKAETLPNLIFDEVLKCTGGTLSDDVAMLALSLAEDV